MITYADPSAIVGTLLGDAAGPAALQDLVLQGDETVLVSEIAVVEVACACMAAERGRRIGDGAAALAKFQSWCLPGKRIRLLIGPDTQVLERAASLTRELPVSALDAIHLAVALEQVVPIARHEPVRFLTRDPRQAEAARALGFTVA